MQSYIRFRAQRTTHNLQTRVVLDDQRRGGPPSASVYMVTDVPQEERAQIDAVERRLAHKYAELPHDRVAGVVQRAHARFNESKLRDFVPLLVERRAGEELARAIQEAIAAGGAGGGETADGGHGPTGNAAARQAPARWRFALGFNRG